MTDLKIMVQALDMMWRDRADALGIVATLVLRTAVEAAPMHTTRRLNLL